MQEDVRTDSQCIRIHENQQRSVDAAGSPQPFNTSHPGRKHTNSQYSHLPCGELILATDGCSGNNAFLLCGS